MKTLLTTRNKIVIKNTLTLTITNTIMMFFTTMALAQTVAIGSGGDGLIQTKSTAKANVKSVSSYDVEVPYPIDNAKNLVTVKGLAGPEQRDTYCVTSYSNDSKGNPLPLSSNDTKCTQLNKSIYLEKGPIQIRFNNSTLFTEKKHDQPLVIELRKIKVPYHNGKIQFQVVVDLNNKEEQEKLNKVVWINYENEDFVNAACEVRRSDNEAQKICGNFSRADWLETDIGGFGLKFHPDGTAQELHIDPSLEKLFYLTPSYLVVTDPKDGEFVSVLPGTYGIIWKNIETEEVNKTMGITVK